jgi:hypothetical protein
MLATGAYRPGETLKALVRNRDGGCRFPGCSISARQCDLDHVVPWPHGPTAASNLICLCRRHHRVKQRHRWRVRLHADGVVEWVDPAGLRHRTDPVDHLGATSSRVIEVGTGDIDEAAGETAADGSSEPEDLRTSRAELWLAVSVGHATAASDNDHASAANGRAAAASDRAPAAGDRAAAAGEGAAARSRSREAGPMVLSGEEIDELSRAVRAGRFAGIEEAVQARRSEASRLAQHHRAGGSQGCRVDHRFGAREHPTIEVTFAALASHRGRSTSPTSLPGPPPF